MPALKPLLLSCCLLFATTPLFAHLNYPAARYFSLDGSQNSPFTLEASTRTINGQTTKAFGWAAGTDDDLARQDDQRYLRFTLAEPMSITISITSANPASFLPAFSVYAGIGDAPAFEYSPNYHDGALITQAWLASLGGTQPKAGAFNALGDWKIGNDAPQGVTYTFDDLASFTYIGHAADGTAANYGPAAGINGDGLADGFVTATFYLQAGEYTLVVGGANYFLDASTDNANYAFSATVTNIPEPSAAVLSMAGVFALGLFRPRNYIARA